MAIIRTAADYDRAVAAGFAPEFHNLEGFAEACANDNALDDLIGCATAEPDEADMRAWRISADEWREAQARAISASMDHFDAVVRAD